jgi:hypothetical protein
MSARLDALISGVESFLVRLSVAHEDLVTQARRRDATALESWDEVKLGSLKEAAATIALHTRADVEACGRAFDAYADTAAQVLKRAVAGDRVAVEGHLKELARAYAAVRSRAEEVVKAARVRQKWWTAAVWAGGVLTSVGLSTLGLWQQARQNEADRRRDDEEAVVSAVLSPVGACSDADWAVVRQLDRATHSCHVWSLRTWRSVSSYEIDATSGTPAGGLMRLKAVRVAAAASGARDVDGPPGPGRSLQFWVCQAPRDLDVRVLIWWQGAASRPLVRATAVGKGEGPC